MPTVADSMGGGEQSSVVLDWIPLKIFDTAGF